MSIRRRLAAIEGRIPKPPQPRIMVHADGDRPEVLLSDAPWRGGQPVDPATLEGADVTIIEWMRDWRPNAMSGG